MKMPYSVQIHDLRIMRRKTAFRLMVGVLLSVILWVLWFSTTFDAGDDDLRETSKKGSKYFGRLFVENTRQPRGNVDLPADFNSLIIPEINMNRHINSSHKWTDEDVTRKASGLTFRDRVFYLNARPFRIFSGAVHYFRIVPEHWEDRLKKLKACGLNTVETYVAWNLHEPSPGIYNFEGMLDLRKFITIAAELGLYVILRPGPYICSEFDFGGLPGWLLHDPNMKVRSNYPGYVAAVNRFFGALLPMVQDLQFTEGGPIIMVQVENEFSAYGANTEHLKLLAYLLKSYGIKELLVTSDHKFKDKYVEDKGLDFSKYALPTDNFDSTSSNSFTVIRSLNRHFPVMVMEFWTGWFDYWGKDYHAVTSLKEVNKTLNFILEEGGSFNLYMFIGGTNFGFTAGAINISAYQPLVTSYDYDAILTEAGDITPKYIMVRKRLLQFYKSIGINNLLPVPPNMPKSSYGSLQVSEVISWDVLIALIPIGTSDNKVNFMETYKDHDGMYNTMGYIVYSHLIGTNTHWNKMPGVQLTGFVKDRLTAVLNSETFFVLDDLEKPAEEDKFLHYNWDQKWQDMAQKLAKKAPKPSQALDLIVENLGRVNYSPRQRNLFDSQRKGLQGPVFRYIFDIMEEWVIRFINFSPEQCKILSKSSTWTSLKDFTQHLSDNGRSEQGSPTLYRAFLKINETPNDTFVKLVGWQKGVFVINGFNLGRYWNIGPQKTLYLPGPLLKKGVNEILIFEELKRGKDIVFQEFPELQ